MSKTNTNRETNMDQATADKKAAIEAEISERVLAVQDLDRQRNAHMDALRALRLELADILNAEVA